MRHHDHHTHAGATGHGREAFPTQTGGLPAATPPEAVRLRHGDAFDLRVRPVRKKIGDAEVRMLSYNGSIPGPTLRVAQGSEVTVNVTNEGDLETTVHWHGLRLENRYDGVPEETPSHRSRPGERFPTGCGSPTLGSTGTIRTSARTSPRRWASTPRSWSSPPTPRTGPPWIGR
jgi:FtsP/CotA-like multicopper oxidase with cupredoxin domain